MLEQKIEALTVAIEALTAKMDALIGTKPEAVEPEAVEPEAVEPEAVEPEAVEPEAVEPEAVEPEAEAMSIEGVTRLALNLAKHGHSTAIKAKIADLGGTRISNLDAAGLATFTAWVQEFKV
jgi:hypothetical protein